MADQPSYFPKYEPYPTGPVRRMGWVPVAQSVKWPSAQFAPPYLPPGSGSVQPFVYPDGSRTEVLYSGPFDMAKEKWDTASTTKKVLAGIGTAVLVLAVKKYFWG